MQNTCTPTLIPAYCAFSPSLLQFQHEFTVQHFFFNAHTQRHSYIHAHTSTCLQTLLFNALSRPPPPPRHSYSHAHTACLQALRTSTTINSNYLAKTFMLCTSTNLEYHRRPHSHTVSTQLHSKHDFTTSTNVLWMG